MPSHPPNLLTVSFSYDPAMDNKIRPLKINIVQAEVDRLHGKLHDTRVPTNDIVKGAGGDYGFTTEWATNLYQHWRNKYSWRKAEQQINQWPHFMTSIDNMDIHFVHQTSKGQNTVPLLLLHGWPGSFFEFSEIINPLTSMEAPTSFHVVVPSLPGFCWSSGPPRGWTTKDTARIFNKLMERLCYTKYCVQASDWGQFVARELGAPYSDKCRVIHLNYCPGAPPDGMVLTERESKAKEKGENWRTRHVGYAVLMRTRPHCVGWMLQDNPLGLMAFIGEKYDEAANPSTQARSSWKDHILTTVCLYYFTNCIMTSCLLYFENPPHHEFAAQAMREESLIKCPFGYTSFWYDTAPNIKWAVERTGNLVFYRERDYAGHSAALEDPEGLMEDIRETIRDHWPDERPQSPT